MESRMVLSCGPDSKDTVMIASRAELARPSAVLLPEPAPAPGLILPDGAINWGCPCLGGMATGPCGTQFRDAFSCFHYSDAEPKGSDCYEKFSVMQDCMSNYPELYGRDDDDDELAAAMDASAAGDKPSAPAGDHPAPAGDRPAPAGDRPAPAGDRPAPAGDRSAPAGDHPAPAGDRPAPPGDRPAADPTPSLQPSAGDNIAQRK